MSTIRYKCRDCRDTGINLTDLPRLSIGAMSHAYPDGPCPICRRSKSDVERERRESIREMRNEELRWELENEPREDRYSFYDYSEDSLENGPRE